MSRLFVHIQREDSKTVFVKAISSDKQTWYEFPLKYQDVMQHVELIQLPIILSGIKVIDKPSKYRKLALKLTDELKAVYFDDMDNMIFKDHLLEEMQPTTDQAISKTQSDPHTSTDDVMLMNRIKDLELKLERREDLNVKDVERKFNLDKFNKKMNVTDWTNDFEAECARYQINTDANKIDALKLFLEGNALDWYDTQQRRMSKDDWSQWKASFLSIYEKKNWSDLRFAYYFKYQNGPLFDYILRKQRILLESDKDMPEKYLVVQIVISLPLEIQDQIDRQTVNTVQDLLSEIKKIEEIFMRKKKENNEKVERPRTLAKSSPNYDRKPCYICAELKFGDNRFHPVELCFNRELYMKRIKKTNDTTPKSINSTNKQVNLNTVDDYDLAKLMNIDINPTKN